MNATNDRRRYLRWTLSERLQHWTLAISFILLAVTGFALRYPEAGWAKPLLFFESSFGLRGLLHRLAALAFMAVSIYHIGYLLLASRGRALLKAVWFSRTDWTDFWQNLRYFLGRRSSPPAFDHFSYVEKLEYWALIWGSVVMTVTGMLLWFEEIALALFPLWMFEVFTVIHLYEAWLATLAIFVWHFYFVIFNPEIYPLNTSMISGNMNEQEMEREHGRELERLLAVEDEASSDEKITAAEK